MQFIYFLLQDKESLLRVLKAVDLATGYNFQSTEESNLQLLMSSAVAAEFEYEKIGKIQEKFIGASETVDLPDVD